MEMVAATKMRRSQEIALASRPYAFAVLDFLATISVLDSEKLPKLFEKRNIKNVLFVLVSSDKGLAGSFNSAVFKKFEQHMRRDEQKYAHEKKMFLAIGEKAYNYLTKKGCEVVKKFIEIGDYTTPEQVHPITDLITKGYIIGSQRKWHTENPFGVSGYGWDRVVIVSTHFKTALKQEPHIRRILPIDFDHVADALKEIVPEHGKFAELMKESQISFIPDKSKLNEYLIEPAAKEVLNKLANHLFFVQFYHLILEANASEHSARRMAMKTASDNASELGEELNLQYNKSRQSLITKEISEITAGVEALQ